MKTELKFPVLLNSNDEIQDQNGFIIARRVDAEFGKDLVELINYDWGAQSQNWVGKKEEKKIEDLKGTGPVIDSSHKEAPREGTASAIINDIIAAGESIAPKLEPLVIEPVAISHPPCGAESPVVAPVLEAKQTVVGVIPGDDLLSDAPKRKGNPAFVKGQRNPYAQKRRIK